MNRLVVILLLVMAGSAYGEMYTWRDSRGTVFYTNSLHEIPARYLRKARVYDVATGKKGGAATAQPVLPGGTAPATPQASAPLSPEEGPVAAPSQPLPPPVAAGINGIATTPAPGGAPSAGGVGAPVLQHRETLAQRREHRRRERSGVIE